MDEMEITGPLLIEIIDDSEDLPVRNYIGINPTTVRFSEAMWYHPYTDIVIGGQGGIGSWLSFFLARQDNVIYAYDDDVVSETNIGGQLYSSNSIGTLKTEAMKTLLETMANNDKYYPCGKYEEDSIVNKIMFSCFDNMYARKLMFEKWKNLSSREIFIDGRMLLEVGQVFVVIPGREEQYEAELFNDNEVQEEACSAKATSHCGAIIAGYMTGLFNNYMTNKLANMDLRSIPFKYTFELPTVSNTIKY